MRKQNLKKWALGIGAAGLIGALVGAPHFDRGTYRATVTDKERVVEGSGDSVSSKYLVFTELQDGTPRVFENTDSLLEFKFGSSTMQGRLKEGKTYDIHTYGWRMPLFSMYENIVEANEVPQ